MPDSFGPDHSISHDGFSDEQWAGILGIARAAMELPAGSRANFVHAQTNDPRVAREAIRLAEELDEPETDDQDRPGSLIGRFTLVDYLGAGGAGEVYSAHDPELCRTVAIKILRSEAYRTADPERRFIREARAVSALSHPNIVIVHEFVRTESSLAIVMELVPGQSLRQVLKHLIAEQERGAPISAIEIAAIGGQIAEGLATAHAAGVVHRDVKPENVMVTPDGCVKILDFGLAKSRFGDLTNGTIWPGHAAGTPRYMSPEHFQGPAITAASDVFALGIILYELATGRHPFPRNSPVELMEAIANEEPIAPSQINAAVPAWLESLTVAALSKDPGARPSAAEMADALKKAGSPTPALIAPCREGVGFWRRKPAIVGAALVIAALVVSVWTARAPARFGEMVQITSLVPENHATAAALSGNGKFLAYANVDGVFVRTLGSEESTRLHGPANFTIERLAWLPDDTGLIASGLSGETNRTAIWSLPLAGGAARELRVGGKLASPSPDGSRIAFLQDDYLAIWTMASDGGEPKSLIQGPGKDIFVDVWWLAEGRHLLFQRRTHEGPPEPGYVMFDDHYRPILESASADTGRMVDRLPNFFVRSAAVRPGGELLFIGGPKPGEDGLHNLWSTNVDPKSGGFSREYRKLETKIRELPTSFDLSAARDGSAVALMGQRVRESVFVADFGGSPPRFENARELTLDGKASYPHAWTPDSESVIFESDRSGGYDLFLQRAGERLPRPLVTTPQRWEVLPQIAPDGRYVLYAAGPAEGGRARFTLMRVPADGGSPAEVPGIGVLEEFRCSVGGKGRCVARTSVSHTDFVYYEVDPVRGKGRELARTPWVTSALADWDISPDGRFVAMPNHDLRSGRIRIVPLDPAAGERGEREIDLPHLANLSSVVWAPDGSGWFVSVDSYSSAAKRMYHCGLDGHLTYLGPIHGWAVPAPDGKKVAYLDRVYEGNVWMMRRK